jgi:hypothetical protein
MMPSLQCSGTGLLCCVNEQIASFNYARLCGITLKKTRSAVRSSAICGNHCWCSPPDMLEAAGFGPRGNLDVDTSAHAGFIVARNQASYLQRTGLAEGDHQLTYITRLYRQSSASSVLV